MALSPNLQQVFNEDVSGWAKRTRTMLLQKLVSLPLKTKIEILQRARNGRKPLTKSLRTRVKEDAGQAEIIRFSFFAHGYFFDRGVGKGQPLTNRSSKRTPKPWIDAILEMEVEQLADMIVEIYGDDVIDDPKIRF